MKYLFYFLLGTLLWLTPAAATAKTYSANNLPIPYLQDRTRHVVNPDGLLSAQATAQMDTALTRLENERGVQSLVVAVERVEGGDCYEFAMTLGNQLGVGSKQNTGLIILLSTADRCYYILTGEGLEGSLPDAICRRIENRWMVPALKAGDWDLAMTGTVAAVQNHLIGDQTLTAEKRSAQPGLLPVLFLVLFIGVPILLYLSRRQRDRCPRCGKTPMKRIATQITPDKRRGVDHVTETYRCPHCGNLVARNHDEPHDNGTGFGGAVFIPPFFGGGISRGGGFGGGFGGGSFGGGSFGGGGAGGKF